MGERPRGDSRRRAEGSAPIGAYLEGIGRDAEERAAIVRRSLSGAVASSLEETTRALEAARQRNRAFEAASDDIAQLVASYAREVSSSSSDGRSMVILEYDYGTDMDEAYDDLKKKLDNLERQLPDDVETTVMEMNNNASTTMMLSIAHKTETDLYDYVDQKIVPEFEKITSVADVEAMGGSSEYIKIELQSEKMEQYKLTMNQIKSAMSAANLSYPSGDAVAGNLELSVTTSVENDTLDDLKRVPITTSSGQIVYMEDIANVYEAEEQRGGISRYNGQETISLSISKQQSSTAMDVSSEVQEVIESLEADGQSRNIGGGRDSEDSIRRTH